MFGRFATLRSWFRALGPKSNKHTILSKRTPSYDRQGRHYRPMLEVLEQRLTPALSITALMNGPIIVSGDMTPSLDDGTDSGQHGYVPYESWILLENGGSYPIELELAEVDSDAFSVSSNATYLNPWDWHIDFFTHNLITFDPPAPGVYTATYSITWRMAGSGPWNTYSFAIQAEFVSSNNPPVANDDVYEMDANASLSDNVGPNDSDPDEEALTFSLVNDVANGLLNLNADGSFTYVPNADWSGTDSFVYQVSDGHAGGTDTATATITVFPLPTFTWSANQPPSLSLTDRTDAEGGLIDFTVQATDPENQMLSYAALNLPKGLSIDSQTGHITGTIDYTAAESFAGTYDVTIVAVDDQGGRADATFVWTVTDQNRAPQVTDPGSQSASEGDSISLQIQASDQDNDTFIYQARDLPPGLSIDGLTGLISGTISSIAATAGPYTAKVIVIDGKTSVERSFTWSVLAVNVPPEIRPPDDQDSTFGETAEVQIFAVDADEDALTYSAVGLPDGLWIDSSTGLIQGTISASAAASSPYFVVVTVWDAVAGPNYAFNWSVSPVQLLAPPDQTSIEGDIVLLQVDASEADELPLTYSATGLPDGLTIDPATGEISGTLAPATSVGLGQLVTVTASNGTATRSATFAWSVKRLNNSAPTFADPGTQQTLPGADVELALSVTDLDGDDLYFSAEGLPPGLIIDAASGLIAGRVLPEPVPTSYYSSSIQAEDGHGGITYLTLGWSVGQPTITIQGTSLNATEGQELFADVASVQAYAGDFSASINWGDGTTDDSAVYSLLEGEAVAGRHTYAHPGAYTVTITVTDTLTYVTATATTTITVAAAPPLAQPGLTLTILSGQTSAFTLAGFLDPSPNDSNTTYQVTVDWGDGTATGTGTAEVTGQGILVTGEHIYQSHGTYTISVTLTDQDGQAASAQSTVQVGDAIANREATLTVGDFPGNATGKTATIDWGDGTSSAGQIIPGSFQVVGQHTYSQAGTYTVHVDVTGEDYNHSAEDQIQVLPALPAVGVNLAPVWATASVAMPTNSLLGALTFAGESASQFSVQIDWGDGSGQTNATVNGADGLAQILGQHTFAEAGTFTMTVSVRDQANQLVALAFGQAKVQAKANPTPFTKILRGLFKTLDVNNNGTITLAEAENAMKWDGKQGDPQQIKGDPAVALAMVKYYNAQLRKLIGGFFDKGVSERDLVEYDRLYPLDPANFQGNERRKVEFVQLVEDTFEDRKPKLAATVRQVSPRSRPLPQAGGKLLYQLFDGFQDNEAITQGKAGDCAFLATLMSMIRTRSKSIILRELTAPNRTHDYEVTLPGQPNVIDVLRPTDSQIALYATAGTNGLWLSILEKAYASIRQYDLDNFPGYFFQRDAYNALRGQFLEAAMKTMTNKKVDTLVALKTTGLDATNVRKKLLSVIDNNIPVPFKPVTIPVTAGSLPNADWDDPTKNKNNIVPPAHAYAVLAYDPENNRLLLQNPWNNPNLPNFGRTFIITLADFCRIYGTMAFQQQ